MKSKNPSGTQTAVTKRPPEKLTDQQKECLARLHHLRSMTQETVQTYLTNVEHDLLEIIDLVAGAGGRSTLSRATLQELTAILDQLSVRPEKGRRKDLRKIERAIEAMQKLVPK